MRGAEVAGGGPGRALLRASVIGSSVSSAIVYFTTDRGYSRVQAGWHNTDQPLAVGADAGQEASVLLGSARLQYPTDG